MREVNRWAARAAPLWERADQSVDGQRLARWRDVLGSSELWDRRMRSARHIRTSNADWVRTLRAVLREDHSGEEDACGIPFGHAFAPFLRYARRRFATETGRARAVLAPTARTTLETELLEHLGLIASLALGRVYYDFRFTHAPISAFEDAWTRQPHSTIIYRQFVAYLLDKGWRDVFEMYPVLARLTAQSVEQWIENSSRLCGRLAADRSRLQTRFGLREFPVVAVKTGLSDRHKHGQSVASLTFADGQQLMYKPRSVRPEMVFNSVLGWINRRGLSLKLKTVRALDRGTYGWVEFVPHRECEHVREVARFYERAGALLAVLHALGVSDIHYENLIACGEHPVVVDLETLLGERTGSVLGTGVLPRKSTARESDADASALGAAEVQDAGLRFPMWRHSNTDQMTLVEGAPRETEQHRVRLNGKLGVATDYVRELKAGFRNAYGCLLEHRKQLQSHPMMKRFDRLELRILLRDSATYGRMHLHLLYPEYLEDGLDRSIELEWLARPLCIRSKPSPGRVAVYEQERAAMERLDLPLFTTKTWRAMRHDPSTLEAKAFGGSRGAKALRRRLARLSDRDCRNQLTSITRSLK